MHLRMTRATLGTVGALLFFLIAIAVRLPWAIFWIPGIALMWYAVFTADRTGKIPVQNRSRTGLN